MSKNINLPQAKVDDAICNKEGLTPLANLYCLRDAKYLTGTLDFDIENYNDEIVRLCIEHKNFDGGCLEVELRRDKDTSRKIVKQKLASIALETLFGSDWIELTLKQM